MTLAAMKRSRILTALAMVASWSCSALASPESDFWAWFQREEPKLFAWETDQERVFDSVGAAMHRVNPDLTFEFGPVEGGKREFVISAGGIQSAFPAVESLYRAAPSLPRWIWIKFRPRRSMSFDVSMQGKTVKPDDVRFTMVKDGDKVGITLFFRDFSESERMKFAQIGYLFLDQALGEYAVETQVGFIEFMGQESKDAAKASPLLDLPNRFDAYWQRK